MPHEFRVTRFLIIGIFMAACRSGRAESLDLRCDQLMFGPGSDRWNVRAASGTVDDTALRRAAAGRMVVRAYRTDGLSLGAELSVTLTRSLASAPDTTVPAPGGVAVFTRGAGTYEVRPRCVGCVRAVAVHAIGTGRVDTLDFYLGQARPICELPRDAPSGANARIPAATR